MSNGAFSILDRAEARASLLSTFDDSRDATAFNGILKALAPAERVILQEKRDLEDGQAGRSNGRTALGGYASNSPRAVEARKAKAAEAAMMTALQMMMADPAYRAAFEETADVLGLYERAAAISMMESELALDRAQEALALTESQAARMEDGTRVYRGANGEAITEKNIVLADEIAASIVGLENAPLHSTYLAQKQAVADAEATIDTIRVYQVETLGDARDRLYDEDNPIEDIDHMRQMQDAIRENAPDIVANTVKATAMELSETPQATAAIAAIAVPTALA